MADAFFQIGGKMETISIDIETYSGNDLGKCGVYKYVQHPNFDILLFGYAVDGGAVRVADLASGETLPEEVLAALSDESVTKWAFNSNFERVCLSEWLRRNHPEYFSSYSVPGDTVGDYLDPRGWKCSMVWSAYMGLPLSLAGAGAVLGLEEQKLKEGKDLIRYFCVPCKATKANGGRIRNLPEHDREKWERFKSYNQRDVEVEMSIQEKLRNFPVPDFVWEEFWLDQEINDRGILLDIDMVENAIRLDGISKDKLSDSMKKITGLENPNSVAQMKQWLSSRGVETETLGKKDAAKMIADKDMDEEVAEALKLRLQLAKSSVKKYQAMRNAVCRDGRARGMFQFYGANRSGRWAGRIIQLQNLPQNHMEDLEQVRGLVKNGDYEALSMLYDSVPNVLSELIRTAFVAGDGNKFCVADFSSIEARVLAWLAGETWRLELFSQGGDIYCQSASKMFGVPVEKHGVNGHLRQKGKVAELACIAEGQLVLTDQGEVPIQEVTKDMKVWDGEEWVPHDGPVYRGEREVITYEGLTATADHLVWAKGQPEPIPFGFAAASGAHLVQTGDRGQAVRLGSHHQPGKTMEQKDESLLCSDPLYRLQFGPMAEFEQPDFREIQRMSGMFPTKADSPMAEQKTHRGKAEVRKSRRSGISELRRPGDPVQIPQCSRSGVVPDPGVWNPGQISGNRPDRYEWGLQDGKHPVCVQSGESGQSEEYCAERVQPEVLAVFPQRCDPKIVQRDDTGRHHCGCKTSCDGEEKKLAHHQRTARLYDLRNAGPRHRFTVSGHLVHNCGYGGSTGALKSMGAIEMGLTEEELQPLVDSWRAANPNIVRFWWDVDRAVKKAVKQREPSVLRRIRFECRSGMLFITLPSGRKLSYVKPRIGENRFGGESVTYEGVGATKKWERIESYGPKFVENIVQAISRDILCYAMRTLSHCRICAHVHDELIIECRKDASLEAICEQMGRTPPWAEGLILRADGYETQFYKKD